MLLTLVVQDMALQVGHLIQMLSLVEVLLSMAQWKPLLLQPLRVLLALLLLWLYTLYGYSLLVISKAGLDVVV